VNILM